MFAKFDESEKPIIKIKLGLNIKDEEDYDKFTSKWLQLEDNKEEYHYIIDTTDCGLINIKYCYKIAGFIKSIKAREKKYLQKKRCHRFIKTYLKQQKQHLKQQKKMEKAQYFYHPDVALMTNLKILKIEEMYLLRLLLLY